MHHLDLEKPTKWRASKSAAGVVLVESRNNRVWMLGHGLEQVCGTSYEGDAGNAAHKKSRPEAIEQVQRCEQVFLCIVTLCY